MHVVGHTRKVFIARLGKRRGGGCIAILFIIGRETTCICGGGFFDSCNSPSKFLFKWIGIFRLFFNINFRSPTHLWRIDQGGCIAILFIIGREGARGSFEILVVVGEVGGTGTKEPGLRH
jgi:hypothetical protein